MMNQLCRNKLFLIDEPSALRKTKVNMGWSIAVRCTASATL